MIVHLYLFLYLYLFIIYHVNIIHKVFGLKFYLLFLSEIENIIHLVEANVLIEEPEDLMQLSGTGRHIDHRRNALRNVDSKEAATAFLELPRLKISNVTPKSAQQAWSYMYRQAAVTHYPSSQGKLTLRGRLFLCSG